MEHFLQVVHVKIFFLVKDAKWWMIFLKQVWSLHQNWLLVYCVIADCAFRTRTANFKIEDAKLCTLLSKKVGFANKFDIRSFYSCRLRFSHYKLKAVASKRIKMQKIRFPQKYVIKNGFVINGWMRKQDWSLNIIRIRPFFFLQITSNSSQEKLTLKWR